MARRSLRLHGVDASTFTAGIAAIAAELDIHDDFPPEVLAEADEATRMASLPDEDMTALPFVTIDPPGSRDLDQAVYIERSGTGFTVWYAIADVATFVRPGGAVDAEAHRRGQTLYAPDHRIPLHPPAFSEGAASLLPGQLCPALVWRIDLDAHGDQRQADVRRVRVRSRAQYDYGQVQRGLDTGEAPEGVRLLRDVGSLRQERERERGGVSLPLPEQEVVTSDGCWSLTYRAQLPVEEWNAQISLLTGMAAADMMMYAEVGLLRTLPPAQPRAVGRLRRTARALHIAWPEAMSYPMFVATLDPAKPTHAAMLEACTRLLRGAGYMAFEGGVPEQPLHAAIAEEYAHATAPLRRLADRYVGEICVSLCADEPVPEWVRASLRDLPAVMKESDRRAASFDRAVIDLVKAGVLAGSVGSVFAGVVVDIDDESPREGTVVIAEPAVEASVRADAALALGDTVQVRLDAADPAQRTVRFSLA